MDNTVITAISVIAAGVVSILSTLVPVLVEWQKSKGEKNTTALGKINSATLELLKELAHFRHGWDNAIEHSGRRDILTMLTDLQTKYHAWEWSIWSQLDAGAQHRVVELRKRFEKLHEADMIAPDLPAISDEILSLARIAAEKL